jgi:SAM-dependent methyltransferase
MASKEFQSKIHKEIGIMVAAHKPLDWPKNEVDVDVSPDVLARMIKHIGSNWEALGNDEPYWSVLTSTKFKADEIGKNHEEFYATGERTISYFKAAVDRGGAEYRHLQRCFELGCGVGRLSVWLAKMFPEVIAADISPPHLRLAAEELERAGCKNVDLRLMNSIESIEALPSFDCFVSIIVLQHNPPPVIAFLLRTILGKLSSGGLAYFQVPTYRKGFDFKAEQYLANASAVGKMEVHALPQALLWQIAEEADCQILDVREDGWTGSESFISNSVLLRKRM